MPLKFIKQASPEKAAEAAGQTPQHVIDTVKTMLAEVEKGGEARVLQYCKDLDKWTGTIVLSENDIKVKIAEVSEQTKEDIRFSVKQVRAFAEKQKASLTSFEADIGEGVTAGQKIIPMTTAGCYAPGGRYSHIASAIMSVTTARVAGVENVFLCSPPGPDGNGVPAEIVYAAHHAGADKILCLGGVQAIAALRYGIFTGKKADIVVGPGNIFVATAKKLLYGAIAIDMIAGPTEIAIIADKSADPEVVAVDLVSQAEHGPTSPAWLITSDEALGKKVLERMQPLIDDLPELNRNAANAAWRDYGEIVVGSTREELAEKSDEYAPEHLEVHCEDLDWWLSRLRNYGSLFVGEEVTVTHGDKCSGPNHTLPTMGAGRYTGGLSVHKYMKVVTYQKCTRDANARMGATSARISRAEGMEGHARAADVRVKKYGLKAENGLLPPAKKARA
jgi:sulfopropanediol 3-dehydrogenase